MTEHVLQSEPSVRYALGSAMMLLGAVAAALALALVLSGFHMSFYIPLVMPAIIGWGVGTVVAAIRMRFGLSDPAPAIAAAILGATLAYAGYHVIVYLRILDFLSMNLTSMVERAAEDPQVAVQRFFEEQTGHSGPIAYLSFVSTGRGAELSPLGLLGKVEPGLIGTCVAIVLEAVVATSSALAFVVIRSGSLARPRPQAPAAPSRPPGAEIIARTDDETLAAAMHAIDAGDYESAGRVLRNPTVEDTFAVALVYNPYSADAYILEILALEPTGVGGVRARRELSSWDGQALWDELRIQR